MLECAVFHAGPGGSAILGDLGAEVIKIEIPAGDPERHWTNAGGIDFSLPNGDSAMFEGSNRNKRGICLDMKQEKGRAIFDRLARRQTSSSPTCERAPRSSWAWTIRPWPD